MKLFTKKRVLFLFLLIILVLLFAIVRFNGEIKYQNLSNISDKLSIALHDQLEREEEDALRFALVLSQNEAIKDALLQDDEDRGYEILSTIMKKLKENTNTLLRSQIITPEYLIFARSWDDTYSGMPLEDSRKDLQYFKTNKKPRVSIEVGRRLGIKATVPLYKKGRLLGFVEVLQFFDTTTTFFREFGIDLYILMDYDFYNTAVLMQSNPTVGTYIIANRAYNNSHVNTLERLDFKKFQAKKFVEVDDKILFYEPIKNANSELIGAFVMVMPQKNIANFGNSDEDISIFLNFSRKNLYDIVKKETLKNELYKSQYDKALLYLKDTVADEDRELFIQEANKILHSYTKEELIALILKYRSIRRIKGKIR